jgi:hypothetical protein
MEWNRGHGGSAKDCFGGTGGSIPRARRLFSGVPRPARQMAEE